MTDVDRRSFLRLSGGGAVAATTGGMAAILATGRAPAYAQATTVHWLRWTDFVPASDQVLRNDIAKQAEKDLGLKLNIETINANDIQARITSSIQSATGPDIVCVLNNWGQLYADSLVDLSDIAEEIGKAQGGFYETSKTVANDGKKWIGLPWCIVGLQIAYRKSWFAAAGYADGKFPETWEQYREVGKKLKAKGQPLGQTLGHTFGDAPAFAYPYLWSWGGKEVEADGKTVVLDSPATVESVKFMVSFWKDAHDEGGLAWDDSNNNRAFLSGTCSATLNGASIYIERCASPRPTRRRPERNLRTTSCTRRCPRGRAGSLAITCRSRTCSWGIRRTRTPRKNSSLGSTHATSTTNGSCRRRAFPSAPQPIGKSTSSGETTRSCCRTGKRHALAVSPATKGLPRARRLKW